MVTKFQYSMLALEAYYDEPKDPLDIENVSFIERFSSADAVSDGVLELNNSGFFATSYATGSNEIVIAFRGSNSPMDDMADWATNAAWSPDTQDPPYQLLDAWNYYQLVKADNPNATISFTGHSLGGGLAGAMAALVGAEAEVFAPAPFEGTVNQLIDNAGHTYEEFGYVAGPTGVEYQYIRVLGTLPAPVVGAANASMQGSS